MAVKKPDALVTGPVEDDEDGEAVESHPGYNVTINGDFIGSYLTEEDAQAFVDQQLVPTGATNAKITLVD